MKCIIVSNLLLLVIQFHDMTETLGESTTLSNLVTVFKTIGGMPTAKTCSIINTLSKRYVHVVKCYT